MSETITMTPDQAMARIAELHDELMAMRALATERIEAINTERGQTLLHVSSETSFAEWQAGERAAEAERSGWAAVDNQAQNAGCEFVSRWKEAQAAK